MLSKVPEGLLIFLDSNWTRVGDAAFKVFYLYLDLAFCSGDVAQQWIHRGGYRMAARQYDKEPACQRS